MVLAFFHGVFDKEYVVDKAEETFAYTGVLFVFGLSGEVVGHLALCVEGGFEAVAAVAGVIEVHADSFCGIRAEEVFHEVVHDIRSGLQVGVEPEVVVISQLVDGVWECRVEVAEEAVYGVHRYLPYTEEAEDVVNAVCIEVLCHFGEARAPPCKAVEIHFFPVVCG